jgi:hypothetical protein
MPPIKLDLRAPPYEPHRQSPVEPPNLIPAANMYESRYQNQTGQSDKGPATEAVQPTQKTVPRSPKASRGQTPPRTSPHDVMAEQNSRTSSERASLRTHPSLNSPNPLSTLISSLHTSDVIENGRPGQASPIQSPSEREQKSEGADEEETMQLAGSRGSGILLSLSGWQTEREMSDNRHSEVKADQSAREGSAIVSSLEGWRADHDESIEGQHSGVKGEETGEAGSGVLSSLHGSQREDGGNEDVQADEPGAHSSLDGWQTEQEEGEQERRGEEATGGGSAILSSLT